MVFVLAVDQQDVAVQLDLGAGLDGGVARGELGLYIAYDAGFGVLA